MIRNEQTRPTVLSAVVLALALMGDALLYALLPLHAGEFGLSLAAVGVLLAANRLIRLVTFRPIARAARTFGLRRVTIAAATMGGGSTLAFAALDGFHTLLIARLVWGIAYGTLALTTLAYATAASGVSGVRIGISLSVRELGPLVALAGGGLLLGLVDVRLLFGMVGVLSLLAVPVAMSLPDPEHVHAPATSTGPLWPRSTYDMLSAVLGLLLDGVFVTTIGFALARSESPADTAAAVAAVLIGRRVTLALMSPAAGFLADRFGSSRLLLIGCVITAGGALMIGSGASIEGSMGLIAGSAIAVTALPLMATEGRAGERLEILSRLNVSRDAGAAIGPLCALTVYQHVGTGMLYGGAAAALALAAVMSAWRQRGSAQKATPATSLERKPGAASAFLLRASR